MAEIGMIVWICGVNNEAEAVFDTKEAADAWQIEKNNPYAWVEAFKLAKPDKREPPSWLLWLLVGLSCTVATASILSNYVHLNLWSLLPK